MIRAISKITEKAKLMNKKVVVNMSLEGLSNKPWNEDPLALAIDKAVKEGIYFVIAAGNSGPRDYSYSWNYSLCYNCCLL